ncbi:hypothetical protein F8M41_022033 [Gigaspora margarita]|uniref:Uncharacterized protein n=1 Tax=Gigaspora margarita TaxID=4874 RepID=A0A8H4EIE4_GIGMA|nr:hypothetical protein F8M41_022033 [Gigaspora margarita]
MREINLEANNAVLADGEKYDLLIQSLKQEYLENPRDKNELQELRKHLYSIRSFTKNHRPIKTFSEAFEDLISEIPKNKTNTNENIYCLIEELILGYIRVFTNGKFVKLLNDDDYFDKEINKLNNDNAKIVL